MPTITEKTRRTYDKIAKHFSEEHFDTNWWKQEFSIFQKLIKGKKVIDIACGAGRDAVLFEKARFDYTGIDNSPGMLREARKRSEKAKFMLMDFYNLKFKPKTFDGFWAAAAILHAPKRRVRKILQNIKKIIKPGGIGFISIKEKRSLDEGMIQQNKYGGIERYFAFYADREFMHVLHDVGFKIVKRYRTKRKGEIWLCYFVMK
jgi:ubiquinone/menaquinone biosynthesis C-methylase UbiE